LIDENWGRTKKTAAKMLIKFSFIKALKIIASIAAINFNLTFVFQDLFSYPIMAGDDSMAGAN